MQIRPWTDSDRHYSFGNSGFITTINVRDLFTTFSITQVNKNKFVYVSVSLFFSNCYSSYIILLKYKPT